MWRIKKTVKVYAKKAGDHITTTGKFTNDIELWMNAKLHLSLVGIQCRKWETRVKYATHTRFDTRISPRLMELGVYSEFIIFECAKEIW